MSPVKCRPFCLGRNVLTHWGRVTHLCVSKLTSIGSDNGLWPGRRQAIIWTNAGILLIGPLGTDFSEILSEIHTFSFRKMRLKISSGIWRPFCVGLNVLIHCILHAFSGSLAIFIILVWSEFRNNQVVMDNHSLDTIYCFNIVKYSGWPYCNSSEGCFTIVGQ